MSTKFSQLFDIKINIPEGKITDLLSLKAGRVKLFTLVKASAEAAQWQYRFLREQGVEIEISEGMSLGEVVSLEEEINDLGDETTVWRVIKINKESELSRIQENPHLGRAVSEALEVLMNTYIKRAKLLDFMAKRADPKLMDMEAADVEEELRKGAKTKNKMPSSSKIKNEEKAKALAEANQNRSWANAWSIAAGLLKGIIARVLEDPERDRGRG